jgi:hypothetical protein
MTRNTATQLDVPQARNGDGGPVNLSALPRVVNLELYRGDDFGMRLVLADDSGDPADLTGAVVHAQVRTSHESDSVAGEFVTGIEDNVISLRLAAAVSAQLPADTVWDVELEQDEWVTTLVAGGVKLHPDVTRV